MTLLMRDNKMREEGWIAGRRQGCTESMIESIRNIRDSLTNANVHSLYKVDGKLHEQERDVAKKWEECNVELALLGLENQTKVERLMPFRI